VAESEFIIRFSTGCSHIPTTLFDFRRARHHGNTIHCSEWIRNQ